MRTCLHLDSFTDCITCALDSGLRAAEVVELCQGAQNPGPAQCFVAARGLGSTADKTHLCNGAFSSVSDGQGVDSGLVSDVSVFLRILRGIAFVYLMHDGKIRFNIKVHWLDTCLGADSAC